MLPSPLPDSVIIHVPEAGVDWIADKGQLVYPDPNSINKPIQALIPHNAGTNVTSYGYKIAPDLPGMTIQYKQGKSPSQATPNPPYNYPEAGLREHMEMATAPSAASYAARKFSLPAKRGEIPYRRLDQPLAAQPIYAKLTPKPRGGDQPLASKP